MTQRILVVDDDKQVVQPVAAYLEEAGFAVLTAYDGETAQHLIRWEPLDLIVLGLALPGHDGLEITRWLRADPSLARLPVLMLTTQVEEVDKFLDLDLELGADDYLIAPFNPHEVLARVRTILRRANGRADERAHERANLAHILQIDHLRLDLEHHLLSVEGAAVPLTPTEFSLLQTLMENPDHAFTRLELIEKALGDTYAGTERTLDSHVKNLRKKIEADPAEPRYLETVFGVGYRLRTGTV